MYAITPTACLEVTHTSDGRGAQLRGAERLLQAARSPRPGPRSWAGGDMKGPRRPPSPFPPSRCHAVPSHTFGLSSALVSLHPPSFSRSRARTYPTKPEECPAPALAPADVPLAPTPSASQHALLWASPLSHLSLLPASGAGLPLPARVLKKGFDCKIWCETTHLCGIRSIATDQRPFVPAFPLGLLTPPGRI